MSEYLHGHVDALTLEILEAQKTYISDQIEGGALSEEDVAAVRTAACQQVLRAWLTMSETANA